MSADDDETRREAFRARLLRHQESRRLEPPIVRWLAEAPWDALQMRILFDRVPAESELEEVRFFLMNWRGVAGAGGFGGRIHDMRYLEEACANPDDFKIMLDMGSAEQQAVDVLLRGLIGIKQLAGVPISQIILGWPDETGDEPTLGGL